MITSWKDKARRYRAMAQAMLARADGTQAEGCKASLRKLAMDYEAMAQAADGALPLELVLNGQHRPQGGFL